MTVNTVMSTKCFFIVQSFRPPRGGQSVTKIVQAECRTKFIWVLPRRSLSKRRLARVQNQITIVMLSEPDGEREHRLYETGGKRTIGSQCSRSTRTNDKRWIPTLHCVSLGMTEPVCHLSRFPILRRNRRFRREDQAPSHEKGIPKAAVV